MRPASKNNMILKFFGRFILTNLTIFTILQQYVAISSYLSNGFDYESVGPYMARTTTGLHHKNCYSFYDSSQQFVQYFFYDFTHQQYMQIIKDLTQQHGQMVQIIFTIMAISFSLTVEFLQFVSSNPLLEYIDKIFTVILPHFTLMMNAISWGDQCIEKSAILDIFNYSILSYAGQFTFGSVCTLLIIYGGMECLGLMKVWWCAFLFAVLVCLQILYIITLDIASFFANSSIQNVLFSTKIIVLFILSYL